MEDRKRGFPMGFILGLLINVCPYRILADTEGFASALRLRLASVSAKNGINHREERERSLQKFLPFPFKLVWSIAFNKVSSYA